MKQRAQLGCDRIGAREQLSIGLRAAGMEQGGPCRMEAARAATRSATFRAIPRAVPT
ncbi:MAG: hypothetical protein ACRED0_12420 [Gammaproteobacteria bacterium]